MILHLPYPPSTNRLWRTGGGRTFSSPEATTYKRHVKATACALGATKIAGDVAVGITLHPRQNRDGSASARRIDLDNAIKVALDGGNGVLWQDDQQVVMIEARVGDPLPGGGLTMDIVPMEQR